MGGGDVHDKTAVTTDCDSGGGGQKAASATPTSTRSGSRASDQDGTTPRTPPKVPHSRSGSGWGGVWTPRDSFEEGLRRTQWAEGKSKNWEMPARVYVDNRTIIREIGSVTSLRRGDHCLVAINMVRACNPTIDRFISWLGSLECSYFYHHFIMVDDVDCVDEVGVPRTREGRLAEIVEYANTLPQALEEIRVKAGGGWRSWPRTIWSFVNFKCHCCRLPLADYGDTPHIYVVIDDRSPEEREVIVQRALDLVANPKKYHFLFNNCEHVSNAISKERFTSPNVHFINWNLIRWVLTFIGLFLLNYIAGCCYSKYCMTCPWLAFLGYHLCTSIPIILQAFISYLLVARSLWQHYKQELIKHDDFWHLQGKELGRAVVAGGGAAIAISYMPMTVSKTRYFVTACAICSFAYSASDLLYNLLCHAVMRCVLLPLWGKVWLIDCCGSRKRGDKPKAE